VNDVFALRHRDRVDRIGLQEAGIRSVPWSRLRLLAKGLRCTARLQTTRPPADQDASDGG